MRCIDVALFVACACSAMIVGSGGGNFSSSDDGIIGGGALADMAALPHMPTSGSSDGGGVAHDFVVDVQQQQLLPQVPSIATAAAAPLGVVVGGTTHPFALVSDDDQHSRDPAEFLWRSSMQAGSLVATGPHSYDVVWGPRTAVYSHTAHKNRSMELSELVLFRREPPSSDLLLAVCDATGIVFKLTPDGAALQRWAIADGNGDKVKPCKLEWATVRKGVLWVGSMGKEWVRGASVLHRDAEWVKTIDQNGRVRNHDWGPVYGAMRRATNTTYPGYLWHEAVHFDAASRRWVFLPRKESRTPYEPREDERRGSNLLILADEALTQFDVTRVGPLEPEWGFASVRKVPGTRDVFMALKVREVDGACSSKLGVFDTSGRFYTNPPFVPVHGSVKYEGLEFLDAAAG